jgi:hypothetical protein
LALLSTAIGATGAAGAAAISGWSARRQAAGQIISQQTQWLREKRRDTYGAFLDAGVQARDELTTVWRLLKGRNPDLSTIAARLEADRSMVNSVKRASATNFVEGPELILEPTRRAEESIVLLCHPLPPTDAGPGVQPYGPWPDRFDSEYSRCCPGVVGEGGMNRGLVCGVDHEQGDVLIVAAADRSAEDDDAGVDETVGEPGVLVPALLLSDPKGRVPVWSLGGPYREHRHGTLHLLEANTITVPQGSDTRVGVSHSGGPAAQRVSRGGGDRGEVAARWRRPGCTPC